MFVKLHVASQEPIGSIEADDIKILWERFKKTYEETAIEVLLRYFDVIRLSVPAPLPEVEPAA